MNKLENVVGDMYWDCCHKCAFYDVLVKKCGYLIWDSLANKMRSIYVMEEEIVCKSFINIIGGE